MLNLLKEYSKKSPYQYRFPLKPQGEKFSLEGLRFRLPALTGSFSLVVQKNFYYFLIAILLLYLFAAETGNDWLYLLTAGGFTTIAMSVILPFFQVFDVSVSVSLPHDLVVGDQLNVRIKLDRMLGSMKFAHIFPVKWLVVRVDLKNIDSRQKFSILEPVSIDTIINEEWIMAQNPSIERGVYEVQSIQTFCCFPFSLAWWSRSFDINSTTVLDNKKLVVFPSSTGIPGSFLYRLRASGNTALMSSASRSTATAPSTSVKSLREFQTGDGIRLIHWASSAKAGKLLVREFEHEGLPSYDVLLDLMAPWRNQEQFELAVSVATSLLNLGFRMGGSPYFYVIPDPEEPIAVQPEFLLDMPLLTAGMARWSQMLARVQPLTSKDDFEAPVPHFGVDSKLALLAVLPVKNDPEGDGLNGVELWVLSRRFKQLAKEAAKEKAWQDLEGVNKNIPLHTGLGSADRRGATSASIGRVIATLQNYDEISAL